MSQQPIILALTDGKAGHETQTQGIVQLLNHQQQYQVEWFNLKLPSKWHYRWLKWLMKFQLNTAWLAAFLTDEQLTSLKQKQVAFIISAGGNTLIANALLKKELSQSHPVQNIVASSLRGIKPEYFDAVFTIDRDKQGIQPFVYYPIAPNKMLSFDLEGERQQAQRRLNLSSNTIVVSILIGADTKDVQIGTIDEWVNWLSSLIKQSPEAYFIISTSRRTINNFEDALNRAFTGYKNVKLILIGQGNTQNIQDIIYVANMVICSPDSTSMVSESLMAGKKLVVPLFLHSKLNDTFQKYYADLEREMPLYCGPANIKVDFNVKGLTVINHAQNIEQAFNKALNK